MFACFLSGLLAIWQGIVSLGAGSFTGWTCLGGCLVAREVKIWCFYPTWQSYNCMGGGLWVLVLSAGEDAVLLV